MTNLGTGLFGRSALERLLGAGWYSFTDSSGGDRQERICFTCGCTAHEAEPGRFHLAPCDDHRDTRVDFDDASAFSNR